MTADRIFEGKPVLEFDTGSSRRKFLKMAGLVGVGATFVAGGAVLTAPTAMADAKMATGTKGDLDILNYALTLEYLEADYYAKGLAAGVLSGRELELITPISDHEKTHVSAVTDAVKAFGGTPVSKPKITYPAGAFDTRESFLKNAAMFEELGVKAYHGQVTLISSGDVLASAAAIAGVESRHAAILAQLTATNPFPAPVEGTLSMDQVLAEVKPLIS
ncbi:ferritin-like domain-containing protein [Nakamurella aerolata]|uniref:Ferritin-like domain-containing protein n=1 Tax=Nakamurella aerolata TaxID=1656892 RepID=A0A849AEY5_9ACTN|nr:ferritin-like domain-containing protein [Nakamurella aerolata]NNG37030.1 ferritin-like domain-containing protein [Nakamurella aerolata]